MPKKALARAFIKIFHYFINLWNCLLIFYQKKKKSINCVLFGGGWQLIFIQFIFQHTAIVVVFITFVSQKKINIYLNE